MFYNQLRHCVYYRKTNHVKSPWPTCSKLHTGHVLLSSFSCLIEAFAFMSALYNATTHKIYKPQSDSCAGQEVSGLIQLVLKCIGDGTVRANKGMTCGSVGIVYPVCSCMCLCQGPLATVYHTGLYSLFFMFSISL